MPDHICVRPSNESFIAAGLWQPAKQELDNIRANLLRNSRPFRRLISSPRFEEFFGEAKVASPSTSAKSKGKGKAKGKKGEDQDEVEEKEERQRAGKDVAIKVEHRERTNIFGREDELKVAPKGVPKDHP